jgi:hypothetical protein
VELFIGGSSLPVNLKRKKGSLKVLKSTTRGMIKISMQGNIYQSGKRVDLG